MLATSKELWRRRHLALAVLWVVLLIPSLLWWKDSVLWVIVLSIYANFEASLAAYNAQRTKEKDQ